MTEHYFTNNENLKNEDIKFSYDFLGKSLIFNSNSGVFSKNELDDGSVFLAKTIINDTTLKGDVLDLGCGYGAIGILLASNSEEANFILCDVNERAVEKAKQNIVSNHLQHKVFALTSFVTESVDGTYDFCVTNPPFRAGNQILFAFFNGAYDKLKEGGMFYAVLRKKQGAETYARKIGEIFGNVEIVDKKKGYVVVKAIKKA